MLLVGINSWSIAMKYFTVFSSTRLKLGTLRSDNVVAVVGEDHVITLRPVVKASEIGVIKLSSKKFRWTWRRGAEWRASDGQYSIIKLLSSLYRVITARNNNITTIQRDQLHTLQLQLLISKR